MDILKSLRVRRTEGKSLVFMVIILAGYCLGITAKLVKAAMPNEPLDPVIALYILNWLFVAIDILLYVRFSRPKARL